MYVKRFREHYFEKTVSQTPSVPLQRNPQGGWEEREIVKRKPKASKKSPQRRSRCPLNIALEVFGDSWSLLILRDMLFKGYSTFKQFRSSNETVSTNILADRLQKMTADGLIHATRCSEDRRVIHYHPTRKGLDLAPVMVVMMQWTDKYEAHSVPGSKIAEMVKDRDSLVSELMVQFDMV
jgi:DNA-binding HxlR family transcriptional regulator